MGIGTIAFLDSCTKQPLAANASSTDVTSASVNKSSTLPGQATIAFNPSLLSGTWHVTYSFDKKVTTAKYAGFTFSFSTTGLITSTKGTSTTNGTWTSNPSQTKFTTNFGLAKPLSELNEDWKVISQTAVKLELIHVSGGNGGIDYLTLEQ